MLQCAILPVDPLDGMGGEVGAHRFAEGGKEGCSPKRVKRPKRFSLSFTGSFISAKRSSISTARSVSSSSQTASAPVTSTLVTGAPADRQGLHSDLAWEGDQV